MTTREEVSAGGVVYRRLGDSAEIVLGSRWTRAGTIAWGLPKGQIDDGEGPEEAALREVLEETGLTAVIDSSLGEISYFYVWEGVRVHKVVHFFLMRATGGDVARHDRELEEVVWVAAALAADKASYPSEREILARAAGMLA